MLGKTKKGKLYMWGYGWIKLLESLMNILSFGFYSPAWCLKYNWGLVKKYDSYCHMEHRVNRKSLEGQHTAGVGKDDT